MVGFFREPVVGGNRWAEHLNSPLSRQPNEFSSRLSRGKAFPARYREGNRP